MRHPCFFLAMLFSLPAHAQFVVGTGFLTTNPGRNISASAVSGDGRVVFGSGTTGSNAVEPFRWTFESNGPIAIGRQLGEGCRRLVPTDAGFDGSAISAEENCGGATGDQGARWSETGAWLELGDLNGAPFDSVSRGISATGSFVCGRSEDSDGFFHAVRWNESAGMTSLGFIEPGYEFRLSDATAINHDGSVVAGWSRASDGTRAFRWTEPLGMIGLDGLFPFHDADAWDISADGGTVLGRSFNRFDNDEMVPVLWNPDGSMTSLGTLLAGGKPTSRMAMSADASVVIGQWANDCSPCIEPTGFYWTQNTGILGFTDAMSSIYAIDFTGWTNVSPVDISDDGLTVVGFGFNPSSELEGWVAVLGWVCPADINNDGTASPADFTKWLAVFADPPSARIDEIDRADVNNDGSIDPADFTAWLAAFQAGCP